MRKVGFLDVWTCFGGWDSRNAPFFEDPFPVEGMMNYRKDTGGICRSSTLKATVNNFQGSSFFCFEGGEDLVDRPCASSFNND